MESPNIDSAIPSFRILPVKYKNKTFLVTIDREDYDRVKEYKWHIQPDRTGRMLYVTTRPRGTKKTLYMHRFIMGVTDRHIEVDHRDHNGLQNMKANLRMGSRQDNMRNRRVKREGKSCKYKGVDTHGGKFRANIKVNSRRICLGEYKSDVEAAKAYDTAARIYFREYAALNFAGPGEVSALS